MSQSAATVRVSSSSDIKELELQLKRLIEMPPDTSTIDLLKTTIEHILHCEAGIEYLRQRASEQQEQLQRYEEQKQIRQRQTEQQRQRRQQQRQRLQQHLQQQQQQQQMQEPNEKGNETYGPIRHTISSSSQSPYPTTQQRAAPAMTQSVPEVAFSARDVQLLQMIARDKSGRFGR